jgi:hypothetical protein
MSPWLEFGFPRKRDSGKQGKLGPNAGAPCKVIGLVSMRVRQTGRRPKIAAAFPEPNS